MNVCSMFLEAAVAAQGWPAGSCHGNVNDAADDGWDICKVVREMFNCIEDFLGQPIEDDAAALNAGSRKHRVMYELNSNPKEIVLLW